MRLRELSRWLTWASRVVLALLAYPSLAAATGTPIPHGTLELVAENQWIPAGHEFNLGLHFQLEKGWHIYWINPGDSGEPPRVTWHLPAGLTAEPIEWPTPIRLGHSTIVDFGYEDSVTLIVPVRAEHTMAADTPAQLGAEVKVLICREMCVPGKAQLSLTLPVKSQPPAPDMEASALFSGARKSLPRPAPKTWRLSAHYSKDSLILTGNLGNAVTHAYFFPLIDSQIDNAAPQRFLSSSTGFQLTLRKSTRLLKPIDRLQGVLVLSAGRAYVIDLPLAKPAATSKPALMRNSSVAKIRFS